MVAAVGPMTNVRLLCMLYVLVARKAHRQFRLLHSPKRALAKQGLSSRLGFVVSIAMRVQHI